MKKINLLLFLCAITLTSCHSDDVDSVIDCTVEAIYFDVSETVDVDNPKSVTFTLKYTGDHTLDSVKWNFGDESSEVTGTTVTHEYSTSGTYDVKAYATIKEGSDGSCSHDITKKVVIE